MSQKRSNKEFSKSQEALKNFMEAVRDRGDRADVTVRMNGTIVHEENCRVFERIETNHSYVDIIWEASENYHINYKNDYQSFKSYDNILVISKTEDFDQNDIEIEIRK